MAVNSIVQVNVSVQVAPTPPTLQKTGAIISLGGTITSAGTSSLLTQLSDLTPLLVSPAAISTMSWTSSVITVTTTAPHGLPVGKFLYITIAGSSGSVITNGANGAWYCDVTGASTFTFVNPTTPGTITTTGATWVLSSSVGLLNKATTFFAQGSNQAVFVLELGTLGDVDGIAALTAYLTANPNTAYVPGASGYYYSYLVPGSWDSLSQYTTLLASYESPTSRTYFFTSTTLQTYTNYTALQKDVFALIPSPALGTWSANAIAAATYTANANLSPLATGSLTFTTTTSHGVAIGQWFQISGMSPAGYNGWFKAQAGTTGSTLIAFANATVGTETVLGTLLANNVANTGVITGEDSIAAPWFVTLNYAPSTTNRVTPTEYSFIFGVTPFPTRYNNSLLTTLKLFGTNIVGTGAEGGISGTITLWGHTMDGNDFTYWYSVDWVQINLDVNTANAVINGSNNPINPLYYNQAGINYLQAVGASTMSTGIIYGLVNGTVIQTALDGPVLDANLSNGDYTDLTVVNAVPFVIYSEENPGDYKIGQYAGFSVIYMPNRGFDHIVYNVLVTELIAF